MPDMPAGGTPRLARRVAIAVTALAGAAAATTALAAPAAASTNGGATWNRVAACESGQNWHIDTGNGYYGGLQFSAGTWAAYGGHKYAGEADNASRLEQIEVARRVLAAQGPGAWPVCGPRAGLTRSSGHATSARLPSHVGETSRVRTASRTSHRPSAKHHHRSAHAVRTYRVRSGDTLSSIARREHVQGGWHALYIANRSTVHDPDMIRVGQVLRLP